MSELKTYKMVDEKYCADCVCVIPSEVYLKSEADAVLKGKQELIAEKDKEIRRLKRALYKACANWADVEVFERTIGIDDPNVEANRWALMRNKCLKKAEEFK